MKTHKNLYQKLCSYKNLDLAFTKAKKGRSNKKYVLEFEDNLDKELNKLKEELEYLTYSPKELKRFIIRDPKTRTIHSSVFRDRIVHHALINVIQPIFEGTFIYDSFANQINKGTHKALSRFDFFKRKVSKNNTKKCFILKADIRHYFDEVSHEILINIIKRKIKDEKVIWLIKKILSNFNSEIKGKGMPLGNLTSQFFANVYLNELDYFVKHKLKIKYYIRYVDDFIIFNSNKEILEKNKEEINKFLKEELKLELHPDKSRILLLKNGVTFLGYRVFYYHKLLKKNNLRKFEKSLRQKIDYYNSGILTKEIILESLQGWLGYAISANTFNLRKRILIKINQL